MVETIRGFVRPIITFIIVAALVFVLIYLVIKFADLEMSRNVVAAFLVLVASITGFWFGQRTAQTPTNGGN